MRVRGRGKCRGTVTAPTCGRAEHRGGEQPRLRVDGEAREAVGVAIVRARLQVRVTLRVRLGT